MEEDPKEGGTDREQEDSKLWPLEQKRHRSTGIPSKHPEDPRQTQITDGLKCMHHDVQSQLHTTARCFQQDAQTTAQSAPDTCQDQRHGTGIVSRSLQKGYDKDHSK